MTRVAVIGGGPAGLATAWYLLQQDPSAEVTVLQQGWRLGGKGASSRGPAGRIEEHGIHLFGNFYANALSMMEAVYAERGLVFEEEFLPNNLHIALHRPSGRRYAVRVADVTARTEDEQEDNINPKLLLARLFESVFEAFVGMTAIPSGRPNAYHRAVAWVRKHLSQAVTRNVVSRRTARYDAAIASMNLSPHLDGPQYVEAIRAVMRWAFAVKLARWLRWTPRGAIRHATVDLLFATLRGTLDDDVFTEGIDSIDDEDHLTWLRRHGASEHTLRSPVARTVPNICFQYRDGRTTADPSMSASAFLNFVLRQLAAPGPNFWYFKSGTGESIVLPLYDALHDPPEGRNAVSFEFFTRVTDLVPSADGSAIESIRLRRHARPVGDRYDPILDDGTRRHWPAGPLLDRIHPEDRQAIAEIEDLEDWYELLPDEPGEDVVLRRGEDFDTIVLATPPPTHRHTCPTLLEDPEWAEMVGALPFIATQGVQLWYADPGADIGLPAGPYRERAERWSTAEWDVPNSCWVDFSDLVETEDWSEPEPGSLFYFCGPLDLGPEGPPDPSANNAGFPDEARSVVAAQTETMLDGIRGLLPGAVDAGAFRYERLVDPDRTGQMGPARLATQYLRPNVVPTELYGVSSPGHVRHRPAAWQSGYDNLVLAGDWVYTGFNINSFEGATISGALAAYAISGGPDPSDIVGYDFMRPEGGPRRQG